MATDFTLSSPDFSMKTREIPSYASNYMTRSSQGRTMYTLSGEPGSSVQTNTATPSQPASADTNTNTVRTSPRALKETAKHKRSQSKDRRADKRNSKLPLPTCLTRALSEIAQETPDVPTADVAAFANRSVEARQAEAKTAGKIKRPLNAFMLYRKAYQDIAKTQCSRNSHQQVSTICGSSWNSWEPSSVVMHFKELAAVERDLHEGAFPDYKYDPGQANKPKEGIEQEPVTVFDISDGEASCRRKRGGRQRASRSMSRLRSSQKQDTRFSNPPMSPNIHSQTADRPSHPYRTPLFPEWYAYGGLPLDLEGYVAGHASQQAANDSTMGTLYDYPSSDPHNHPYPAFVDPRLGSSLQPDQHDSHILAGDQDIMGDWMSMEAAQRTGIVPSVLDLDAGGAHNAYLRGTESDWQVEQLASGSYFSDWMAQAGDTEY